MRKIAALVIYDLKKTLQDYQSLLFMLFFPLVILLIIVFATASLFQNEAMIEPFQLVLVNEDDTLATRMIVSHFEEAEELEGFAEVVHADYDQALNLLAENKAAAAIIIPEGFSADLERGQNTPIEVVGNHQRPLQALLVRTMMQSGTNLVTAAQSGVNTIYHFMREAGASSEILNETFQNAVWDMALHSLGRGKIFEQRTVSALENVSLLVYYALSFVLIFLLFGGLLGLKAFVEERENRLINRLIVQGVRSSHILVAKWLSVCFVMLLQLSLLTIPFLWVLGDLFQGSYALTALVFISYMAAVSALMLMIAVLAKSLYMANVAAFTLLGFTVLIGGSLIPLIYLPNWAATASVFSIHRWATDGLLASMFTNVDVIALQSVGVLSVFTVCFLLIAHVMFKLRLR